MIAFITSRWPYLADVIQFGRRPGLYLPAKQATLKDFMGLMAAELVFILPFLLFVDLFSGGKFDTTTFDDLYDNPVLLILFVVILAPVLEELYFRYHQNRKYLSIILTLVVTTLAVVAELYFLTIYLAYLMILLGFKLCKKEIPIPLMVYFVSGIFALVHLSNFEEVNWMDNFYWAPFLVFSQFIGGIILSYIRLHEGLIKAIVFHGAWNGSLSVFMFLPE